MGTATDEGIASQPPRVIVVGGGIAGLAAAWFLQCSAPNLEVVVLEASGRIGGKLAVSEVAGLAIDEGAESLLARRPEAVDLVRAIGLGADLVEPATTTAAIWSRGAMRTMPARTVMGVPSDLRALAASHVLSVRGLARVPLDLTRSASAFARGELADVGVGAYVAERLGPEVSDRLVEPLLGGVYAGHARDLSLTATVPALAAAARGEPSLLAAAASVATPRPVPGAPATAPPAVFASLRGGLGRLPPAVAAASKADVRTGSTVRELTRTATGWRLVVGSTHDSRVVDADAVVLAVPATPLARLLADVLPHAAADVGAVEYASVGLVSLVYQRGQVTAAVTGSGFLVPPIERRVIKAATVLTNKWEWLADDADESVVVRCSVGRHREAGVLQRDDSALSALVQRELAGFLGVRGEPVATRVSRWGGALPQYAVGHNERIARVRSEIAGAPGLSACGAAFDGVGVAACVASARSAVDEVLAYLNGKPPFDCA